MVVFEDLPTTLNVEFEERLMLIVLDLVVIFSFLSDAALIVLLSAELSCVEVIAPFAIAFAFSLPDIYVLFFV